MHPEKAILDYKIEASALLDIMCILDIKEMQCKDKLKQAKIREELLKVRASLISQLGKPLFTEIQYSHVMNDLWQSNLNLFLTIDKIKTDESITAKHLDSLNYKRFEAKKALQSHFFGELTEVKIGYSE